jgi:drug/metabolite transporter (DMT)-like permease
MSRFLIGNVFLFLSMTCAASSQIITKALLNDLPEGLRGWAVVQALLTGERFLRAGLAGTLLVAGFVFWIFSLARLELSYAYPIACSSLLLVALFSALFLGEPVTLRTWVGTLLILLGIALLTPQQ